MPTKILIKRSTTAGEIPTTSDLQTGELAVNTADKRIFTNNSGTIVELGTTPTALDITGNVDVGGTFDVVGQVTVDDLTATGTVDLTGATTTVAAPTADSHAATKLYVDTEVNAILDGAPAALDTLNEIAAAINDDANLYTTLTDSIATKLALAGGTMTGNIVMGANKVTSTATPTADDDLTRKGYVDGILGSATSAATSATNAASSASSAATSASTATTKATEAATSATNAATSESNASTSATAASSSATSASNSATAAANSATSAATSATNAENAFDSFDDRYLGAKASDPTVDNDGDALITGAMYFDSTNNVMKVYNGTEWANASSSIEGIKSDFQYTATASQTVFSGNDDDSNELVIDKAGLVNVYLNGVRLSTDDYTVSAAGNSVTLGSGAAVNDIVEIEVFGNFAGQSGADVAITGGSITGLSALTTDSLTVDTNTLHVDSTNNRVGIGTTSPAENLHINSSSGSSRIRMTSADGSDNMIVFGDQSDSATGAIKFDHSDNSLSFNGYNNSERMRIDSNGNVGIGTTSPAHKLHVNSGSTNEAARFESTDTEVTLELKDTTGTAKIKSRADFRFETGATPTEAMRIDSSGNVGIGTSSPTYELHVADTDSFAVVAIEAANNSVSHVFFGDTDQIDVGRISYEHAVNAMPFQVNGSEAMRIDSSGNLLVGTTESNPTSSSVNVAGQAFSATGGVRSTVDANPAATFNRKTSDGPIALFRKDGTTVGSIVASGGDIIIGTGDTGLKFHDTNNVIYPANTNNSLVDATIDLGRGAQRFKDLYLSGGVYLGGTGSANHLDDYEEGTWTPTLVAGGTLTVVSGTNATYTKVGRTVTVTAYLQFSGITSNSYTFKIGGLPFSAPLTVNAYGSGSFSYTGSANTNNMIGPLAHPSNYLYFHRNDGSVAHIKNSDVVSKSLTQLIFSTTYITTE